MPFTGAEGKGASRARVQAPPKIFRPCNIYKIKCGGGFLFYKDKFSYCN